MQRGLGCMRSCSDVMLAAPDEPDTLDRPVLKLKASKEKFVSDHSGANLTELCLLVALVPLLTFLVQWCCETQAKHVRSTTSEFWPYALIQIICVVLPTILAVMSESVFWPLACMLCISTLAAACWTVHQERLTGLTKSLQLLIKQHRKRSVLPNKQVGRSCNCIAPQHCNPAATLRR